MLKRIKTSHFLLGIFIIIFANFSKANSNVELTEKDQKAIIESIVGTIKNHSIYPEISIKIQSELLAKLNDYKYLGYEDTQSFASKLTKDLLALSFDKHIEVKQANNYIKKTSQPLNSTTSNSVKLLNGNVGLVVFDLNSTNKQIDRVFLDVEKADVLIIDLRDTNKAKLETIQYISSYLFKKRTLLNKVYLRESNSQKEYWTNEHSTNKKRPDLPIYLLTNASTSGGAEVFAATLKRLNRAYIVGESTKGNINPRRDFSIGNALSISIPYGQINHSEKEIDYIKPDLLVVSFLAFKETYPMAKHSAVEYRVKQGRGTPQEAYSLNRDQIIYPDWQFFKGQCLIKYRISEPRYNEKTKKYQFPYQIKYYGNGRTRVKLQLGNKTGRMTQKVIFSDRDDIKSGISKGFLSHNQLSILACKVLS
ncbi:S41 family peptidase [Colwellia sp. RSH04]|uniref:S41 family peptidase n=1 Tax=Colwellia sp. RSH04 TaxID=2305464 RepID=UPI000E57D29A|nr:S41 family peptidase [Colwellia sp. RSH04]RHW76138.1 hypothetical protein D1094_10800 [Colwellia sp. RSH04]